MVATASTVGLSGLPRRLVRDGIVEETAIQEAQVAAKEEKTPLVAYLIKNELAESRDVAIAASQEFGVPLLDLDAVEVDADVVRTVNEELLVKHRVLPLLKRGKKLFVGVSDPTNLQALDEIKFQTGFSVDAIVVEQDKLEESVQKALEAMDTSISSFDDSDFDLENLDITGGDEAPGSEIARDDVDDAPVVRFVNKILLDAINNGSSDIHFEPYENVYRVRTRLDGVLREVATPPHALSGKLAARLKVMARLDIAERRVPQDGRIKMRLSKKRAIDFRVNTCPTLFGEKIVFAYFGPKQCQTGDRSIGL